MNTIERRIRTAHRRAAIMQGWVATITTMRAQDKSILEIAKALGLKETTVRNLIKDHS